MTTTASTAAAAAPTAAEPREAAKTVPAGLTLLLAASCGLIAGNLYYAQPLAGPIGADLHLSRAATGLIVTLTQLGYGLGLLLIVPLADLVENRLLVRCLIAVAALALLGAGLAPSAVPFLIAALIIGIGSVAIQVLVPYAAHMAPEAVRGRVVGNVVSGLLLGIMMARPIASMIAQVASWHTVFLLSAAAMAGLALLLGRLMPPRRPGAGLGYGQLLVSMGRLAVRTPVLQRRALYQAGMFGAFSLFWTTSPLLLAGPAYRLSQGGIALFALAGVAGAIAAPIAGRLADRGWTRPGSGLAMLIGIAAFAMTRLLPQGSPAALALLVAAAITLDFGVSANLTFGQRAIFLLGPEVRGRLNGLYLAIFFAGGALGSALGGWAYAAGGWPLTAWIGAALPAASLLYFATERRQSDEIR